MTAQLLRAGRRCHNFLNSLHSTIYFSADLGKRLSEVGVHDQMGAYLVGRAAPLGPVDAGLVTATFYGFKHDLVAQHIPSAWRLVSPDAVVAARLAAADATLRRLLGDDGVLSAELSEAAELALRATEACSRHGRPLYAANAGLPAPDVPHLALWHASTLLREHRGEAHFAVLMNAELDGLESLLTHSASSDGMPKEMVVEKRGWTRADWAAAERRLAERGLMTASGELTELGVQLRAEVENETDRLDRAPYEHLGTDRVERLTELADGFVQAAARADAFPPPIAGFFTRG
jgi:hypothetical protein